MEEHKHKVFGERRHYGRLAQLVMMLGTFEFKWVSHRDYTECTGAEQLEACLAQALDPHERDSLEKAIEAAKEIHCPQPQLEEPDDIKEEPDSDWEEEPKGRNTHGKRRRRG